jgi:branched-chain amino acid transport system substrate-binding protein
VALAVAQTIPDCVLISADTENNAVLLTDQVASAVPHAMLFGTAGLAETSFTDPAAGGIPPAVGSRMLITVAIPGVGADRAQAHQFLAAYAPRYGAPQPYAIFGYAAMELMLGAISRSTGHGTQSAERSKVLAAIFATRNRYSVVGTYTIKRDGDTTLRRYGAFQVVRGRLRPFEAITG